MDYLKYLATCLGKEQQSLSYPMAYGLQLMRFMIDKVTFRLKLLNELLKYSEMQ